MDDQELRKLLEQIQSEIKQTKSVDEKGRERLRQLDSDIHELLARSEGEQTQPQPSIVRRLQDTIDHFEATHPALTATLSRMLDILNNAGI